MRALSRMSMSERISLEPRRIELHERAGWTDARPWALVTLDPGLQCAAADLYDRKMLMDFDNAAGRRGQPLGRENPHDQRFAEGKHVTDVERRTISRFDHHPDRQCKAGQHDNRQDQAEVLRIVFPEPPHKGEGAHDQKKPDKAENEDCDEDAKVHRRLPSPKDTYSLGRSVFNSMGQSQ
jgi:hypothetical protein